MIQRSRAVSSSGGRMAWGPALLALLALTACRQAPSGDAAATDVAAATQETETWRAAHERSYRENWSTIAGLHFLEPGSQTVGSAASNDVVLPEPVPPVLGSFVLNGEVVRFEPAAGVSPTLNDQPLTAPVDLADDGAAEADELKVGDIRMVIHRSGARKSLRVWDPDGPQARGFLGFSWFPIQMDYRVTGRFIRDAAPQEMVVLNTFGDRDLYKTEGTVEFTLNGQTLRLRPFTTDAGRFYFVFRDGSSGEETYEAARFLYSDLRDDGTTVLDFNQAYNPPCAFNPFTTCPIPIPENRLSMKILAGERAYPEHPAPPGS